MIGGSGNETGTYALQNTGGFFIAGGCTDSYGAGSQDMFLVKVWSEIICITDVHQLPFPSKTVKTVYNLVHQISNATFEISMQISDDGGINWQNPAHSVYGDIGVDILVGEGKIIYWDAGIDYPEQYSEQMQVKIFADEIVN